MVTKVGTKILIVGSDRHAGVRSVSWQQLPTTNVADFDTVIVNVGAWTKELIWKTDSNYIRNVRMGFARLITSNGTVIAVGGPFRVFPLFKNSDYSTDSYGWSPIFLKVAVEEGDTIRSTNTARFGKLLENLQKWEFHFNGFQATDELKACCGYGPTKIPFEWAYFLENRYNAMLAGEVWPVPESSEREYGSMILLPYISTLDARDVIELVLEDLLGAPRQEVEPDWCLSVSVPFVESHRKTIEKAAADISALESQIDSEKRKIQDLEVYKVLLHGGGRALEEICARCLRELGAAVEPAQYSQEEFVFRHRENVFLVECKGIARRSISLSHLRQLDDYVLHYEEDEGEAGRGILFGNAWKDMPLEERGLPDRPIFPDNVIKRATERRIGLIDTVQLFHVFCYFLTGDVDAQTILDRMTHEAGGVINFDDVLRREKLSSSGQ